jgi:hypothetical protein
MNNIKNINGAVNRAARPREIMAFHYQEFPAFYTVLFKTAT